MNIRSMTLMFALVALVSGCQSTSIRSAWFDTDFTGPPFRKIVVVGITESVTEGRVFEDVFAQRLRAAGVEGVPGYTVVVGDAQTVDTAFTTAIVNSGAQGLLLVRLLGVDTRTQVSTTMVPAGMGWGRGPWGSPSRTMVPVQQVRQYDLATVEAKLFDVQTKALVWAATTSTLNPRSMAQEAPGFADLVIGQLADRGIIARK
jgi:hypothetical protein